MDQAKVHRLKRINQVENHNKGAMTWSASREEEKKDKRREISIKQLIVLKWAKQ